MILTCPNCGSRFELAAELLAPKGKKVKCSSCAHTWHQLPDPAELQGEDDEENVDDDFAALVKHAEKQPAAGEDIPQGVKPDPKAKDDLDFKASTRPLAKLTGIAAGIIIWALVFFWALTNKNQLIQDWPASAWAYELAGIKADIPGEGLVFDKLQAVTGRDEQGQKIIQISGTIINLKREDKTVPLMEASLRDENAQTLGTWHIQPPQPVLEGESMMEFTATYLSNTEQVSAVNVRFLLGK